MVQCAWYKIKPKIIAVINNENYVDQEDSYDNNNNDNEFDKTLEILDTFLFKNTNQNDQEKHYNINDDGEEHLRQSNNDWWWGEEENNDDQALVKTNNDLIKKQMKLKHNDNIDLQNKYLMNKIFESNYDDYNNISEKNNNIDINYSEKVSAYIRISELTNEIANKNALSIKTASLVYILNSLQIAIDSQNTQLNFIDELAKITTHQKEIIKAVIQNDLEMKKQKLNGNKEEIKKLLNLTELLLKIYLKH